MSNYVKLHIYEAYLQIQEAIFKTLNANGMFDNAHIRLTLTRGKKVIFLKFYSEADESFMGIG